ncbi:Uncharacterised protein g8598 [Pycnogonum litorale]
MRCPTMIPDPDYSDEDMAENHHKASSSSKPVITNPSNMSNISLIKSNNKANDDIRFDEGGLIVPKKIANPCIECRERQDINKELLFNKKIGKNVLGQKSELKKVMEKFHDDLKKKEIDQERIANRSSFEKRLDEQAKKLKETTELDDGFTTDNSIHNSEFRKLHAKLVNKKL